MKMNFKKLDRKIELIHDRAYIKIAMKMAKEANYRHIESAEDVSQTCENCSRPCTASWVLGKVWADKHVCDFWKG